MTEAIEKDVDVDVSNKNETQKSVVLKTKHDEQLERIVAQREKAAKKDEPDPEPHPELEPAPNVQMIDLIGEDGNVIQVPATAKFKAKIDGQEVEVPFENMARSYQKGVSGDKKLEQAAQLQKSLEAKEQALEAKGRELSTREKSYLDQHTALEEKKEAGKLSDDAYREKAKKLLHAFAESDSPEDDLVDVLKGLAPQSVDTAKLRDEIRQDTLREIEARENAREEQALMRKQESIEKKRVDANTKFTDEYSDVIKDPIAYGAAKELARNKWGQKPDADPWEIAQEVGNEIRAWMQTKAPSEKTRKPPVSPRTTSARAKSSVDEAKPQTRTDIIKEMKKSRGQPV